MVGFKFQTKDMKISKKTQYGLRAMVYLANAFESDSKICSLRQISKEENISFDYLEKIVSELEKKGLVSSKRGSKGGYFLVCSPKKIKIGEIMRVLEKTMFPVECLSKEKEDKCPREKICKTIGVWKKIQESLDKTLSSITLADLLGSNKKKKL